MQTNRLPRSTRLKCLLLLPLGPDRVHTAASHRTHPPTRLIYHTVFYLKMQAEIFLFIRNQKWLWKGCSGHTAPSTANARRKYSSWSVLPFPFP